MILHGTWHMFSISWSDTWVLWRWCGCGAVAQVEPYPPPLPTMPPLPNQLTDQERTLGCHKTFCEERAWWLTHHASAGWVGPWSRGQHWGMISWYCMDHEFGFMWRNSMEEFGRIVFEMPNATITWTATKKTLTCDTFTLYLSSYPWTALSRDIKS